MSNLTDILISAQSQSGSHRTDALDLLTSQLHSNPGFFLLNLSKILSNPETNILARQLSGFYLKNTILNSTQDQAISNLWTFLPTDIKSLIKDIVLSVLADESKDLRQVSAQIIASIAKYDIPNHSWPNLLKILIMNAMNIQVVHKETALMTLGYICEEIPQESLTKEEADGILTAIVSGLESSINAVSIIKSSLTALQNSIKFIRINIENPNERKAIFHSLYALCTHPSIEIRSQCMSVISNICYNYYEQIASELVDLGNITYRAIKNDEPKVMINAIEFWNSLADIENERILCKVSYNNYINTAAASLVPILLEKIHIFDNDDDDEWTIHRACSSTLSSIASIVGDPIVEMCYGYISVNIMNSDWKLQKSAILVFGSVLEGPSQNTLSGLIRGSLLTLIPLVYSENIHIRKTAAWCLNKVCQNYKDLPKISAFKDYLEMIKKTLTDTGEVASHTCNIIHQLTEQPNFSTFFYDNDFDTIISQLLQITLNHYDDYYGIAAISVLSSICDKVNNIHRPKLESKLPFFIDLLQSPHESLITASYSILHNLFGKGSLGVVTEEMADKFMSITLNMFKIRGILLHEALETIGALVDCLGRKFIKYLSVLVPALLWAVREEYCPGVCMAAIMCLGDLARALNLDFIDYIPSFIHRFYEILSSSKMELKVKIEAINTLGDFCAIPGIYEKHMRGCMTYIESAAKMSLENVNEEDNPDLFDAIISLRYCIIIFYINLIHGVEIQGLNLIIGNLETMIEFCIRVTDETLRNVVDVHINAMYLVSDLVMSFKDIDRFTFKSQKMTEFVNKCLRSQNNIIRDQAHIIKDTIDKL
ncbi:hypothetical protein SteCoe_18440 [Stentor coeruleus]|uniref:Importin N-terminal domain-containing protein n=1 Tax=Stentor coeruleus TaxID=5963 RepID=A0A1R2BWU5_9CILI|nr:hypothetical protein SteCoe_18440 [Stentor coeruleus]